MYPVPSAIDLPLKIKPRIHVHPVKYALYPQIVMLSDPKNKTSHDTKTYKWDISKLNLTFNTTIYYNGMYYFFAIKMSYNLHIK